MSSLFCCIWWFLAGIALGWLLNRWLCKSCCKKSNHPMPQATSHVSTPAASAPPVAPAVPAPVKLAETPVQKVVAAPVTPKPKAPTKPKAAPKPKAVAKAKVAALGSFDAAAAKAAGFSIKKADDLTVVEGIGPKINTLLIEAGIHTFDQLAKASVPEMRAILDKAGPSYRIANPSTWAQQGALAADNKWAELKKLQDELSAGVKK